MIKYDRTTGGHKRLVLTKAQVLQTAVCDGCGADLLHPLRSASAGDRAAEEAARKQGAVIENDAIIDAASFDYGAGYLSPWDGDSWHADLCPECALKVKDLINQGIGPGVQTENDQWGPAGDEDWAYTAPFSEELIARYHGQAACRYHTDQTLVLTEDGLVCPLEYCDENYWYVGKGQFDVLVSK